MMAYIDPATGSMLFTLLVSVLGTGTYALRELRMKSRFFLSRGKSETNSENLPFVIFSDSKRYWNLFEPICDEFEKRGQTVTYYSMSEDDPALTKRYDHVICKYIGTGNKAFNTLNTIHADIILSTTPGLDVYQWRRSENAKWYSHILHMINDPATYRMFGLDYYDSVLLSGSYQINQIRELESLRSLPAKELEVVGMPYLDSMKERARSLRCKDDHETTILLAPSWGESSILQKYGGKIIKRLLETGYHIIIRPHPQSFESEKDLMNSLIKEFPASDQLEWNRDNDNFEVLSRADLLISDYSNVMFDFSFIFRKPFVYVDAIFDKSPYDACWLKEELWTFEVLPKIGSSLMPEDLDHLKERLDILINNESLQERINEVIEESWANIGTSAARTVDYLISKRSALLEMEGV